MAKENYLGHFIVKLDEATAYDFPFSSGLGLLPSPTTGVTMDTIDLVYRNLGALTDQFGYIHYSPVGPSYFSDELDPRVIYIALLNTYRDAEKIYTIGQLQESQEDWLSFIESISAPIDDDDQSVVR